MMGIFIYISFVRLLYSIWEMHIKFDWYACLIEKYTIIIIDYASILVIKTYLLHAELLEV